MLDLAKLVLDGEKRCSILGTREEINASVASREVRAPRGVGGRHVRQVAYQDGDARKLTIDTDSKSR